MKTTRLSSKGQIVLPKTVREALDWPAGIDLTIIPGEDCVVIRRRAEVPPATVDEVAGMLKFRGPPVSLDDMQRAADEAMRARWRRKKR